jgi:hypothetical protein
MRTGRTASIVGLVCALSVSATAFEVFDPVNFIQHQLQNRWRETIGIVVENQLNKVRQMAERLSKFTNLAKYVAPDAPLWTTPLIQNVLVATDGFMAGLSRGDARGTGYEGVARSSVSPRTAIAGFGEENIAAVNALRSALATLDISASAIIVGADQTGRIRGNHQSEANTIAALERDVIDPSFEQSTTAVLDKVGAAGLIRARQQEARMELLAALTEQLLVDSKRDRDTEVAAMNMQQGRLTRGRAVASSLLAGSADDFRSWRQP